MARIQEISKYPASEDHLPDSALNAADVALCTLACTYSWAWRTSWPDKTWQIENLPSCILEPWKKVCSRLGYPQVGLSFNALCGARWRVQDSTAWSYAARYSQTVENLVCYPAIFDSRAEHVFFGVIVETMACFNTYSTSRGTRGRGEDDQYALLKMLKLRKCWILFLSSIRLV